MKAEDRELQLTVDNESTDSDGNYDKPPKRLRTRSMKDRCGSCALVLTSCALILALVVGGGVYWLKSQPSSLDELAAQAMGADNSPQYNVSLIPTLKVARDKVPLVNLDGDHVDGPTLYCFMVVLPWGEERDAIKIQFKAKVSIFQCDEHNVLSSEEYPLNDDGDASTVSFGGDMHVGFNSWTWAPNTLALNTEVFLRAWKKIYSMGTWENFDFTIKTETDTVFIPWRLKALLASDRLIPAPDTTGQTSAPPGTTACGNCSYPGTTGQTCESHAKWVQKSGLTCRKALDRISNPDDCNCHCDESACSNPESVYLRNCAHNRYTPWQLYQNKALHGPIEVMSKKAFSDLGTNITDCEKEYEWSYRQWGEDWFLEHCLLFIGVNPVDSFASLNDHFCSGAWDCKVPAVTFQPKKTVATYFGCLDQAENYGNWPPYGVDVVSARPTPAPTPIPTIAEPTPPPTTADSATPAPP